MQNYHIDEEILRTVAQNEIDFKKEEREAYYGAKLYAINQLKKKGIVSSGIEGRDYFNVKRRKEKEELKLRMAAEEEAKTDSNLERWFDRC